ncbi:MAG: LysR family transcriptional regulator [Pleomorphochaeta sp.]|jgi:DNA-binding transcriptional LysR family regulator
MLDYKINTFLTLCKTMNYRITAERLNMSQPSVTQHIHLLEDYYQTKLFIYDKKQLYKTDAAILLEKQLSIILNNEEELEKKLKQANLKSIRIGATKTIGNYVINDQIKRLIKNNYSVTFIIDNTKNLLQKVDNNELDIVLIEGVFDKTEYDYKLYRKENFIGFCSLEHPFANKKINFEELFDQNLIIREEGSGTRFIFEQELLKKNYSINSFNSVNCISAFEIIKDLIKDNLGITFAYKSIMKDSDDIASFELINNKIVREFNFVCLKSTNIDEKINIILNK